MKALTTYGCDYCNGDLTTTGYSEEYRIAVSSQAMGHSDGAVFSMALDDPVPEPLHFCDMKCLKEWAAK